MDLAEGHGQKPRIAPPLPEQGLRHVLSTWTGEGELCRALAAVRPDFLEDPGWTDREIARRAHRILFERIEPAVARLPSRVADWFDALPAASSLIRARAPYPFPGVNWTETSMRSGWPPTQFYGRARSRGDDSVLISTLRWASEGILFLAADAKATWSDATASVERQLHALAQVAAADLLASALPQAPSAVEILALRREGAPWSAVADAAANLRLLQGPAADIAFDLLRPDEEMRPLLFHLGVLGELLLSLEGFGGRVRSLRPLSGGFAGPAFAWTAPDGHTWDIWFEAGGVWSNPAYGREEPYRAAAVGSCGTYRPLGADVMMLSLDRRALVVECKYPTALGPEYVCRNGYLQAVTYAVEAHELAPEVVALVVGPEGVVRRGTARTAIGPVTVAPPSEIGYVLDSVIR